MCVCVYTDDDRAMSPSQNDQKKARPKRGWQQLYIQAYHYYYMMFSIFYLYYNDKWLKFKRLFEMGLGLAV